jgi:hypothetical protein
MEEITNAKEVLVGKPDGWSEISCSDGGEYEDGCLLGYCAV